MQFLDILKGKAAREMKKSEKYIPNRSFSLSFFLFFF